MSLPEENKALVAELFAAWSRADVRPLVRAMAEDVSWVVTGTSRWSGVWGPKRVVVEHLMRGLGSQFQEAHRNEPSLILADGDRVVVRAQGRTTTVGGESYDNTYCFILRLADRRIMEVVEYGDTALVDRVLAPPAEPRR